VVLGGNLVYDRSQDVRVKHLIEGVEQPNTAPRGVEAQANPHDDEEEAGADEETKKPDAGEKKPEKEGGGQDR